MRNLRQEIAILSALDHENVVKMFDYFETEREFCVVTEFAQGELFEILEEDGTLPEDTVRDIARHRARPRSPRRTRSATPAPPRARAVPRAPPSSPRRSSWAPG